MKPKIIIISLMLFWILQTALSKWLEVEVKRNRKKYYQRFESGNPVDKLKEIGAADGTGTKVTFFPDSEIFEEINFDYETLRKRLQELAFLNKGLIIRIENKNDERKEQFCYGGGIIQYVKYINKNKNCLFNEPIYIHGEKNGVDIEIAIQYTDGYTENIFTFVNNINTHEGGTHLSGFKAGITRVINDYGKRNVWTDRPSTQCSFILLSDHSLDRIWHLQWRSHS